jgi:integrase
VPPQNRPAGIRPRHSRSCPARGWEACSCKPSYESTAWSHRDSKKIRRSFPTLAAARAWQRDAVTALARGELRSPTRQTVRQAAEAWLAGARAGEIRSRSGEVFKPSTIRSYGDSLRAHVVPELGGLRVSDLRRADVQTFVERLNGAGLDPSTVRNAVSSLRVVCRRALVRQEIMLNPCVGLELPAVRGRRTPKVSAEEVAARIAALPEADRALWAVAFFAGLRLGELRALEWADIDLGQRTIHVERSWDRVAGPVAPKSRAGRRVVPLAQEARTHLIAWRLKTGRNTGLVFGNGDVPFDPTSAATRARRAWDRAGLPSITFHVARHICASLMLAAGIPIHEVSRYLGHSSISITIDVYGHLSEGAEARAGVTLDAYLSREATTGTAS